MRAIRIQRLEGGRSPGWSMYFLWDCGNSDGGLGWCYGPGEPVVGMECAEMGGLEAASEGS